MSQIRLRTPGHAPVAAPGGSPSFPRKYLTANVASRTVLYYLSVCVLLTGLLHHTLALAENKPAAEDASDCANRLCDENSATQLSRLLTIVDKTHSGISNSLEAAVRHADRFFASDNVFEETNGSYARLPMDLIIEEDGNISFKVRVKGKLRLPHAKKRLRLLIESDTTDSVFDDQTAASPPAALSDNDFFLSLETQLKKTGKWKIRPATGLKVRWTPDYFFRLRAIRYFAVTENWLGRFSLTGAYLLDARQEGDGNLQFSRALSKNLLFRSASKLKWTHEKGYSEASQVFSLFHHLKKKANLAYQAGIFADNEARGWDIKEYSLLFRYRRLIYKNWLFMDLIPEVRFQQADDYDPGYFLTLRIEPVFGQALPTNKLQKVD